jgi:hypothetical protein
MVLTVRGVTRPAIDVNHYDITRPHRDEESVRGQHKHHNQRQQ